MGMGSDDGGGDAGAGEGVAETPVIDTSVAHPARIYDYWLGGKDNFAADREAGELALKAYPELAQAVQSNRAFLARAVRYLTGEAGIRQFLDIGTGIPAASNTHEVAQQEVPETKIVYVDNDPIVLTHARALLTSTPQGACAYIQADLHDPDAILAEAARTLDFSQPMALMLVAVLHFIPDEDNPAEILRALLDALPSGSYLVASHSTAEHAPRDTMGSGVSAYRSGGVTLRLRDSDEFADLVLNSLRVVPPGVVPVSEWRPESDGPHPSAAEVATYGAVGFKP
jgi:DNA-binding NarL/FixJ family response regulator